MTRTKRERRLRDDLADVVRPAPTQLEKAFSVVPHFKKDEEEREASGEPPPEAQGARGAATSFLEEVAPTLLQGPAEPGATPPRRRGRKRKRDAPRRATAPSFGAMLARLARFKEEHGTAHVPYKHEDREVSVFSSRSAPLAARASVLNLVPVGARAPRTRQLAKWVHGIRLRRAKLRKDGVEVEPTPSDGPPHARYLTADRLAQLDALGFVWVADARPKVSWDARLVEVLAFKEAHGRWPRTTEGTLGECEFVEAGWASLVRDRCPSSRGELSCFVSFALRN